MPSVCLGRVCKIHHGKKKWGKKKVLKPLLDHCAQFWGSGSRLAMLTSSKSMKGGDEVEAHGDEDR